MEFVEFDLALILIRSDLIGFGLNLDLIGSDRVCIRLVTERVEFDFDWIVV